MKKTVITILIIFCLVFCNTQMSVNSYADSQQEFYIKHVHTGNPDAGTGCYTKPVYHTHSEEGGACYSPVYHTHEGTPETGGGCYTVPVIHHHIGDASREGGCYVPKYHEHTSECYTQGDCYVSVELVSVNTEGSWCSYHGDVFVDTCTYRETHHNCGAGEREWSDRHCTKCGSNAPSDYNHIYSLFNCSVPTGTIEGYILGCNHEEGDADHYEPGCNLEGTIVGYALSCTRTEADIDRYDVNCGMEEGSAVARVLISNDGNGYSSEVNVTADIEDLTGGRINFEDATITWYDSDGNNIGTGKSVSVTENGNYGIEIQISNPEIDPNSLKHTITVNNIYVPSADDGNGEGAGALESEPKSESEWEPESNENADFEEEAANQEPVEIKVPPTKVEYADKDDELSTVHKSVTKKNKAAVKKEDVPKKMVKPKKAQEKKVVQAETALSDNSENIMVDTTEQNGSDGSFLGKIGKFLKTPAGKIITVSTGTVGGAGVVLLLLYLLHNVVIVLNDDTQRKRHILGIVRVVQKEDEYSIVIPEKISKRAYTGRYAFYMGLFMIGRNKDIQIVIIEGEKRVSAKIAVVMETLI